MSFGKINLDPFEDNTPDQTTPLKSTEKQLHEKYRGIVMGDNLVRDTYINQSGLLGNIEANRDNGNLSIETEENRYAFYSNLVSQIPPNNFTEHALILLKSENYSEYFKGRLRDELIARGYKFDIES